MGDVNEGADMSVARGEPCGEAGGAMRSGSVDGAVVSSSLTGKGFQAARPPETTCSTAAACESPDPAEFFTRNYYAWAAWVQQPTAVAGAFAKTCVCQRPAATGACDPCDRAFRIANMYATMRLRNIMRDDNDDDDDDDVPSLNDVLAEQLRVDSTRQLLRGEYDTLLRPVVHQACEGGRNMASCVALARVPVDAPALQQWVGPASITGTGIGAGFGTHFGFSAGIGFDTAPLLEALAALRRNFTVPAVQATMDATASARAPVSESTTTTTTMDRPADCAPVSGPASPGAAGQDSASVIIAEGSADGACTSLGSSSSVAVDHSANDAASGAADFAAAGDGRARVAAADGLVERVAAAYNLVERVAAADGLVEHVAAADGLVEHVAAADGLVEPVSDGFVEPASDGHIEAMLRPRVCPSTVPASENRKPVKRRGRGGAGGAGRNKDRGDDAAGDIYRRRLSDDEGQCRDDEW